MSRRGLAAAAVGAAALLSLAPAARAQQAPLDVNGSISAPRQGAIATGDVHVVGHFQASGGFSRTIDWITVDLVLDKPGAKTVTYPFCGTGGKPPCAMVNDGVDFDQLVPAPTVNGPFKVTATAQAHAPSVLGQNATVTKPTPAVSFGVAVKPAKPANVKASVKDRQVTVTWDRNIEADMQYYTITRQGPSDKTAQLLFGVSQPSSGTTVGFIDDKVPAAAGSYTYTIAAVRPGASGDVKTTQAISDGAAVKASLPAGDPNATTTPTQPPPKGTPAGPPILKSTPGSLPRLSSGAAIGTTPTTGAVTPDPGFVRGLPYGGTNTTLAGEGDDQGGQAVALTPNGGRHKSNQKGLLVPAATGAILFVGAFQLRWLKKRLDEPVVPIT